MVVVFSGQPVSVSVHLLQFMLTLAFSRGVILGVLQLLGQNNLCIWSLEAAWSGRLHVLPSYSNIYYAGQPTKDNLCLAVNYGRLF